MVVTNDVRLAERMRAFRGHGITTTASQREKAGAWFYEMTALGYNYRITDFQCALGSSQLKKLDGWVARRNQLAQSYATALADQQIVRPLFCHKHVRHAYHLYVVRTPDRDVAFRHLRAHNIGANVHYIPVHLHPYYREQFHTGEGMCPVAEAAYKEILTLPLWPGMHDADLYLVCETLLRKSA